MKTNEQIALEFAEHLAKCAEDYITSNNAVLHAEEGYEPTESLYDELSDSFKSLKNAVYEFRKRNGKF